MFIKREIQDKIDKLLFKNKIIIIYGARRVGKTTLSKHYIEKYNNSMYINCELLQYKKVLETTDTELLKDFFGNKKLIILDEAQSIKNIGLVLKIIIDTMPEIQIIATGSSSFDLANKVSEPLTGRSRQFILYPFSWNELKQKYDLPTLNIKIQSFLRFGMYPDVVDMNEKDAIEELESIASNYLYKDILQFGNLKRSDLILKLLRAIALQTGNEVSYNELANMLQENVHTVKHYIEMLEKAFIIYRLSSYSRNMRKEIAKGQKIYFYDLGIRNILIRNFNPLDIRNDKGELWENFCINERIKHNMNNRIFTNSYFWRTYTKQEIDYIEEMDGKIKCFEFKFNPKAKFKIPKDFLDNYKNSSFEVINPGNFYKFV